MAGALVQLTGMYLTIIIIVVTMRRSTADILSRPGTEAYAQIEFTPLSPSPPQLQRAGDAQTPLSYGFIEESSDATSTELPHSIERSLEPASVAEKAPLSGAVSIPV